MPRLFRTANHDARLIAHRGGAAVAPENTLPAYAAAAAAGYRWAECDIACTADGVPVLFHDDTLERTTDGAGPLAGTTWANLARLDAGRWFHPGFAGTRVPTLDQALAAWADLGLRVLIELKVGAGQDPERLGACGAAAAAGTGHWLISFDPRALAAAQRVAPDVPRVLVLDAPWPADWQAQAAAVGATAIDIAHRAITAERVDQVHGAGLDLLTWTVNDPARAADLLAWGVDGVTTDAIDRIRPG